MTTPGLIVAAPRSSTGKTTVMLGLLAALRRRGLRVQPFKCGPDYIDPQFHAAAAGRPSYNLDSWAFGPERMGTVLGEADGADLCLAEGSMGLFDGVATPGEIGNGANADIAAYCGWPVLLVLDVSGQAQSAAAIALGCAALRPDITLAGVILNRVASDRHEALIRTGLQPTGIRVLGALRKSEAVVLPERHLGLMLPGEDAGLEARLSALADLIEHSIDLDAVVAAARGHARGPGATKSLTPPGQRIALAQDVAFSFVYPHLLAAWRRAGAEILPFSPLADEAPDESCDAVWLPGGYPELHAGRLAAANRFKSALVRFAQSRPVHGECGGYMVLGAGLVDASGTRHEMAGLLGLESSFAQRRMHLGYRLARLRSAIPGLQAGALLRGHEFHYTSILAQPDPPLADVRDANGVAVPETGAVRGHVTGSFFHLLDVAGQS